MKSNLYSYLNYKSLLKDLIEQKGRGTKRALASHCKVQESYLSTVINGANHLNLEQLEASCRFFSFSDEECQYILLMNQENRAGTKQLKLVFARMMNDLREKHDRLQQTLNIKQQIALEDQATYYSHWSVSAIHLLLLVPGFQDSVSIANKLRISKKEVDDALTFLVKIGLANKTLRGFTSTSNFLHLDKASPFVRQLHTNWRLKAIDSVKLSITEHLHYSGVVTLKKSDFQKVRDILSSALKESIDVIKGSEDEEIAVIGIDFFCL